MYKVLSVNTHSYVIRVRYQRNADKMLLEYVIKCTAFTVEFYLSTTVAMECLHFCSFVFTLLETKTTVKLSKLPGPVAEEGLVRIVAGAGEPSKGVGVKKI